jgi:large subunit ribosomal protein L31e
MPEETQLVQTENVQQNQQVQQTQENVEKKENIQEFHIKINIRKWILKTPLKRRAKKAAKVIREIIMKRYKSKNVLLSVRLNNYIWSRGIKKPPTRYKLRIIKKEDKTFVDIDE